jgi:hypothetical protein
MNVYVIAFYACSLLVTPLLFLSLYFGPAGFAIYRIVCYFVDKKDEDRC